MLVSMGSDSIQLKRILKNDLWQQLIMTDRLIEQCSPRAALFN